MADMDEVVTAVVASSSYLMMAGAISEMRRRKRSVRKIWVKPWILARPIHGAYEALSSELMRNDEASFRNYVRTIGFRSLNL